MFFQIYWYPQLFKDIEEMHEPVMRACIETAIEDTKIEVIIALHEDGQSAEYIAKIVRLPVEKVREVIEKHDKK